MKYTFVATLGLSPVVVTSALNKLIHNGKEIDQVCVVTPDPNKSLLVGECVLIIENYINEFFPKINYWENNRYCVEVPDVCDFDSSENMQKFFYFLFYNVFKPLKEQDKPVILLISGGRKGESAIAYLIAKFFSNIKEVYHIIDEREAEGKNVFYTCDEIITESEDEIKRIIKPCPEKQKLIPLKFKPFSDISFDLLRKISQVLKGEDYRILSEKEYQILEKNNLITRGKEGIIFPSGELLFILKVLERESIESPQKIGKVNISNRLVDMLGTLQRESPTSYKDITKVIKYFFTGKPETKCERIEIKNQVFYIGKFFKGAGKKQKLNAIRPIFKKVKENENIVYNVYDIYFHTGSEYLQYIKERDYDQLRNDNFKKFADNLETYNNFENYFNIFPEEKNYVLFASLGKTYQVILEAYVLLKHCYEKPVDKIAIFYPKQYLLIANYFKLIKRMLKNEEVEIIDCGLPDLKDIFSEEDYNKYLETVARKYTEIVEQEGTGCYFLIAGGRKTMSTIMCDIAISNEEPAYHVLASNKAEKELEKFQQFDNIQNYITENQDEFKLFHVI